MDLATAEAEVEDEEHPEVVAPQGEVAEEVQEEEASSVRKEAQKPLSYVCRLFVHNTGLKNYTGTT